MQLQSLVETVREQLSDPRRISYGNIRHSLGAIVVIGLCAVICGGEGFEAMELIGNTRKTYFESFLDLPNGIPSADTFRRVFGLLDPKGLSKCLVAWLTVECASGEIVAIDGKTIRGSADETHKAFHIVSAFVADNQLTLGQLAVPEKTNEITAIPELLDIIDISETIVTADAMAYQKKIVEKISKKGGDYVIGLKGNQGEFHSDVALYFSEFAEKHPKHSQTEKRHGRVECREYTLCTDIKWLGRTDKWKNLKAVGMVRSNVYHCKEGKETQDIRYYITSLTDVSAFASAVRLNKSPKYLNCTPKGMILSKKVPI